jgi:hypothetical protein
MQLNGVISMDRFILEHRVFLHACYVKCRSGRKCQKNLDGSFLTSEFPTGTLFRILLRNYEQVAY